MRREGRILAVQFLWSKTLNPDSEMNLDFLYLSDSLNFKLDFSQQLITILSKNEDEIIKLISHRTKNWGLSRIFTIDLILLKLALTEINYLKIPKKIVINEYLEIAKLFSESHSPAFINGILDNC